MRKRWCEGKKDAAAFRKYHDSILSIFWNGPWTKRSAFLSWEVGGRHLFFKSKGKSLERSSNSKNLTFGKTVAYDSHLEGFQKFKAKDLGGVG